MAVSPELLQLHPCFARINVNKPEITTGGFTFLTEGASTTSLRHSFCAMMVGVNARDEVLVCHAYPQLFFENRFKLGPHKFHDDFSQVYILLQHLFHPAFSTPLALYILSEYNPTCKTYWRGFGVVEQLGEHFDRNAAAYLEHQIVLEKLKAFLGSIEYIDLNGSHRPYDVRVERGTGHLRIATAGRNEDEFEDTYSIL